MGQHWVPQEDLHRSFHRVLGPRHLRVHSRQHHAGEGAQLVGCLEADARADARHVDEAALESDLDAGLYQLLEIKRSQVHEQSNRVFVQDPALAPPRRNSKKPHEHPPAPGVHKSQHGHQAQSAPRGLIRPAQQYPKLLQLPCSYSYLLRVLAQLPPNVQRQHILWQEWLVVEAQTEGIARRGNVHGTIYGGSFVGTLRYQAAPSRGEPLPHLFGAVVDGSAK